MGGKAHLVGDDDHRHALGGQLLHHRQHLADQLRVQRAGRFVEQHHPRLHGDGAGDGDALLLAARQPGRVVRGLVAQPDLVQRRAGQRLGLGAGQAADPFQPLGHVLQRGHVRPQVELLEHHADVAPHLAQAAPRHQPPAGRVIADQLAVDADLAGVIAFQEVDAAQQRRLARPGRADQAGHLSGRDVQADIPQRLEGAVELVDPGHVDRCGLRHLSLFRYAASRGLPACGPAAKSSRPAPRRTARARSSLPDSGRFRWTCVGSDTSARAP